MEEFTCARCGKHIETFKFIMNSREVKILNEKYVLHFCNPCVYLMKNGERKNENL